MQLAAGVPYSSVSMVQRTIFKPAFTPALVFNSILAVLLLGLVSFNVSGRKWTRVEADLFHTINDLPGALAPLFITIMQLGSYAAVFVLAVIALIFRRFQLAIGILLAGNLAYWLAKILKLIVGRGRPADILHDVNLHHIVSSGLGYPSGHTAVATALGFMLIKFVPRRYHRYIWLGAITVGIARIYVGAHWPIDVVGGFLVGWLAATIAQIVIGGPNPDVWLARVRQALAPYDLTFAKLNYLKSDAQGSIPLIGETVTGRKLFIKVTSGEHRDADLLYKLWRRLVYRGIEDEAPFVTPQQKSEHEAYMSLRAERAGVRTPPLVMNASDNNGNAYLIQQYIQGRTLESLAQPVQLEIISDTWQQLARLHDAGIAHRDMRGSNILIHDTSAYIIDLGFATENADTQQRARDIVELLVTSALACGPAQAVSTAKAAMSCQALLDSLPYLQKSALSHNMRRQIKPQPGLLERLRTEIEHQCRAPAPRLAALSRVGRKHVLALILFGLAIHFFLPQIGELKTAPHTLAHASLSWLAASLFASALTYLCSAFIFRAAAPGCASFRPVLILQIANSFANRFAPAGLGSVALGIRFLQKLGMSTSAASTVSAVIRLSGIAAAIIFIPILLIFARHTPVHIAAPTKGIPLLLGLLGVLVVAGIILAIPNLRRRVHTVSQQVLGSLRVISNPRQLIPLLLWSLALTITYGLCLYFALRAVGVHVALPHVLLVFVIGSSIGLAAPTPGGIGGVEAALVSGLAIFGAPTEPAITGVLIYRIFSFWLPILPGYVAYRLLRRENYI